MLLFSPSKGGFMDSKTLSYILKRIVMAVFTLWAVITITFFVMHAVPGGPFTREKAISAEAQAALNAKYGLDKPLFEQYTTYLVDALHGNFGPSIKQRGRQVTDIIIDGMGPKGGGAHTPEEWLDRFNTFSIYQVLPEIIKLWGLNVKQGVEAKKNADRLTAR
jgi:hypothetical protein